jgi:hypothetical protein
MLLYTEIIQVVEKRQRYWARPVLLCESLTLTTDQTGIMQTVYDVRFCADLLWPRSLFYSVFDTELIPLLDYLTPETTPSEISAKPWVYHLTLARQKLHQFTQQLWQADPTAFQDDM